MSDTTLLQTEYAPWLGVLHLHLQSESDGTPPRPVDVAFWARSRDECEQLVAQNARRLGIRPLWLEDALLAETYQNNGEITTRRFKLARAVSPSLAILLDGDALELAEREILEGQKNPWTDFLENCKNATIAFPTMENLELTARLNEKHGGFKHMLGIVMGSMTPTVALVHLRDIPDLDELLWESGPEFAPLLIHPPVDGPFDYESLIAPPLNEMVPFINHQKPPEMLLEMIKEENPDVLEYLVAPMPLLYSRLALAKLATRLTKVPYEEANHRGYQNMLTMRDDDNRPTFYEIPEQKLMSIGNDIDWREDAEEIQNEQLRLLCRHALFDLTPEKELPLEFIDTHFDDLFPIAEMLKKVTNSVPYPFFIRYMLPTILKARAEGFDLSSVPQVERLLANTKIALPQKMMMFSNVVKQLRKMRVQAEKEI